MSEGADLEVVETWCALEDDFRTLASTTVAYFDLCSGV